MTLSLPADRPEVDSPRDVDRWVVLDDPGMDRLEPEFLESDGQHLGRGSTRTALTGARLVTEHNPDVGGLEMRVDVAQPHDTDRPVIRVGGEYPEDVRPSLDRNLEPLRAHELAAVAEVLPLVIFPFRPTSPRPLESARANQAV
jgi:hypothetical protein